MAESGNKEASKVTSTTTTTTTTKTTTKTTTSLQKIRLSNGVEIPKIGFGCAFGNWVDNSKTNGFAPELAWKSVRTAIQVGYRHLDTAHYYGTDRHIGSILGRFFSEGSLKREDIFITSKVCHPVPDDNFLCEKRAAFPWLSSDLNIRQRIMDDLDLTLHRLGVGYVDLLLMHWPGQFESKDNEKNRALRKQVWEVFEELNTNNKVRAIGVCNFTQKHLEELLDYCKVRPVVNQVELHPYCPQTSLVKWCIKEKIVPQAYSPFASGSFGLLRDPVLKAIAETKKKNVGQIILRWLLQRGCIPIAKSNNEMRSKGNRQVFDFQLDADEMKKITALGDQNVRRTCADPSTIA